MSLKDDLKKVIGACKEDIEIQERIRQRPPPTMEKMNAQIRASRAFREKYNREHGNSNHSHSGPRGD
jgi:hypothetical protein